MSQSRYKLKKASFGPINLSRMRKARNNVSTTICRQRRPFGELAGSTGRSNCPMPLPIALLSPSSLLPSSQHCQFAQLSSGLCPPNVRWQPASSSPFTPWSLHSSAGRLLGNPGLATAQRNCRPAQPPQSAQVGGGCQPFPARLPALLCKWQRRKIQRKRKFCSRTLADTQAFSTLSSQTVVWQKSFKPPKAPAEGRRCPNIWMLNGQIPLSLFPGMGLLKIKSFPAAKRHTHYPALLRGRRIGDERRCWLAPLEKKLKVRKVKTPRPHIHIHN